MVLLAAALGMVALAWWPGLALLAEQHIDAGMKRALVTFGLARAVNAVISVLQGTSVAVQPFGVGMNLTVGQVLEPVNRLVEQLSTVMLVASVALGIERILLAVGSWWVVCAALTIATLACCRSWWLGQAPHPQLTRALALLLVVRFAVPVVAVGSDLIFQQFLGTRYAESVRGLEESRENVQRAGPGVEPNQSGRSIIERLKDAAVAPVAEVRKRYEAVRSAAEIAIGRMVDLIVIFVLQTVLIPLVLLWGLLRAARLLIDARSHEPRRGSERLPSPS